MVDFDVISLVIHWVSVIVVALVGTMASSFLVTIGSGEHWGKLRFRNGFIKFWRLFVYFMIEVLLLAFIVEWGSPLVETYLHTQLDYIIGISSAIFGVFFLWFVYTLDCDIKTQYKWAFPTICFAIAFLNLILIR